MGTTITVRALLVGDRIDIAELERPDMISASPLAFHVGAGMVALYRFGIAVMAGLSPIEEEEFLKRLEHRVEGKRAKQDDEIAIVEKTGGSDDTISPGGPMQLVDFSEDRFLVLADALAKSVALTRDEREVNVVFDTFEPFALLLADRGKIGFSRKEMLNLIGQGLLVQHRVAGRIAVEEKPDVLWDRSDLERFYARLEDEYELKERAVALQRKIEVIVETARVLTEIMDTNRSTRLEVTIVALIVFEVVLTLFQMVAGAH